MKPRVTRELFADAELVVEVHLAVNLPSFGTRRSCRKRLRLLLPRKVIHARDKVASLQSSEAMFSTVIITGASKGYGRVIAKTFARLTEGNMHFVLSGRNATELSTLKDEIQAIRSTSSSRTHCEIVPGDIGNTAELTGLADRLFGSQHFVQSDAAAWSITFVNNAGSLGPIASVGSDAYTSAELASVVNLNITGCIYLTSEFVRR
jgi:short-subunit dehydrogenase